MSRAYGVALRLSVAAMLACSAGFAQSTALSLSSGSGIPGSVAMLNLVLSVSGTQPAALQWTLNYSTSDFSAIAVTAGSAATTAGKAVSCNSTAGNVTCLISGINFNTISSGV